SRAGIGSRSRNGQCLGRMDRKEPLRSQIYGHGTREFSGRCKGRDRPSLAQGEGSRPCGGRARRGQNFMTQGKRFGPRLKSRSFFWQRGKRSDSGTVPGASAAMKATMIERIWIWIHATFPERQIYIRSDGRVQFFTFGPSLQATLAGLVLIFLGWVAFATVNVIFKDRIIAAKDHRYQQMQTAYENRVADLQISYDELNAALVSAQDRFKATADALATKQNAIAGFLNRASQVQTMAGIRTAPVMAKPAAAPSPEKLNPAAPLDVDASPDLVPSIADAAASSALTVLP